MNRQVPWTLKPSSNSYRNPDLILKAASTALSGDFAALNPKPSALFGDFSTLNPKPSNLMPGPHSATVTYCSETWLYNRPSYDL